MHASNARIYIHNLCESVIFALINILKLINMSAAAFYALGSLIRFAKDENDPHESKFDLPLKMKLLSRLMNLHL